MDDRDLCQILLNLWQRRNDPAAGNAYVHALGWQTFTAAAERLSADGCRFALAPGAVALVGIGLGWYRELIPELARQRSSLIGRRALVFRTTASTNDIAWQAAPDPHADGLVVLADQQTRGRGRRGAPWLATPGQSVLLSVLLRNLPHAAMDPLTLRLGLAVAEALEPFVGRQLEIKWPNDVLADGKKLAGVMVETRPADTPDRSHVVLGIGVNINQTRGDFEGGLRENAVSLYLLTGNPWERLGVIEAILRAVEGRCRAPEGDPGWLAGWKNRCRMFGQPITIRQGDRLFRGRVADIEPLEGLVLRDDHGLTHLFSAQTSTLNLSPPDIIGPTPHLTHLP